MTKRRHNMHVVLHTWKTSKITTSVYLIVNIYTFWIMTIVAIPVYVAVIMKNYKSIMNISVEKHTECTKAQCLLDVIYTFWGTIV